MNSRARARGRLEHEKGKATVSISHAGTTSEVGALDDARLARLDAYWRAANYLTVGQI
jgi:hypothetical protein